MAPMESKALKPFHRCVNNVMSTAATSGANRITQTEHIGGSFAIPEPVVMIARQSS